MASSRPVLGGADPKFDARQVQTSFSVENFKATLDDLPASVVENPGYLKYTAPLFKSVATVKCHVPIGKRITVGFIQQVNAIDERQDYTRAFTTWEQPSLPVSDFDGNTPPWSGSQHERVTLAGVATKQTIEVSTNDQPYASVGWREPLPPNARQEGPLPDLQEVKRTEHFTTWLVARDSDTDAITVLKKVTWTYRISIAVDPGLPLGSRATVKQTPFQPPIVETPDGAPDERFVVPPKCLCAPSANQAGQLWWNPEVPTAGHRVRLL